MRINQELVALLLSSQLHIHRSAPASLQLWSEGITGSYQINGSQLSAQACLHRSSKHTFFQKPSSPKWWIFVPREQVLCASRWRQVPNSRWRQTNVQGRLPEKAVGLPPTAHSELCAQTQEVTSAPSVDTGIISCQISHDTNIISSIYVLIYEAVCRRSDEALEFLATHTLVKKNAADAVASLNQNHCWDEWSYTALAGFLVSDILKKQALVAVVSKKPGIFIVPGNCTSVKCILEVPWRNNHFSILYIQRPCSQGLLFNKV